MDNSIFKNYFLLLFITLNIISCSSMEALKINAVNKCLGVNKNIETTSQCLSKLNEYKSKSSIKNPNMGFYKHWITDNCDNPKNNNCSDPNLIERLKFKKTYITVLPFMEKRGGLEVVSNPYELFYSKSENLSGPYVKLYIFYDKKTKMVIGWVNNGWSFKKYDFKKNE